MAEATTGDVPSHGLREHIARQTRTGERLSANVTGFGLHLRWIKERFSREVDPLHLSDEDYARVSAECGLAGLLRTAHGMAAYLDEAAAA